THRAAFSSLASYELIRARFRGRFLANANSTAIGNVDRAHTIANPACQPRRLRLVRRGAFGRRLGFSGKMFSPGLIGKDPGRELLPRIGVIGSTGRSGVSSRTRHDASPCFPVALVMH